MPPVIGWERSPVRDESTLWLGPVGVSVTGYELACIGAQRLTLWALMRVCAMHALEWLLVPFVLFVDFETD